MPGRHFGAIRVINALFLALAIAIACGLATRLCGYGAAAGTAALGALAPHYHGYALLSMTEPMSAALLILAIDNSSNRTPHTPRSTDPRQATRPRARGAPNTRDAPWA